MKNILFLKILFFCVFSFANEDFDKETTLIIEEMHYEISFTQKKYEEKVSIVQNKLNETSILILHSNSTEEKLNYLILKDQLKDEIARLQIESASEISKIRYIKGLQIIKILYEKVLGLDHHFASVTTFSEISKISNPNQYPEFDKLKNLVKEKRDKKQGFDLTKVLGTNTLVSVVNTFSNMMVSGLSKEEKETELAKVECILDFTLRMQTDLNTIYYETAFLQAANDNIKADIETLFKDYTKSLNYMVSLKECRNNDDWDAVRTKLDDYIATMNKAVGVQKNKMLINLEFPIDRLIQFITQYNDFINDGEKFYQKFETIINSYENEKQCESQLPIEYKRLKDDIKIAIEKFNVAYRPVEINGSKMKEILYGINEFQ